VFFERALASGEEERPVAPATVQEPGRQPTPMEELLATSLDSARVLGARTAELHAALASRRDVAAFAPEPFTVLDQRALIQSIRTTRATAFRLLRPRADEVPGARELLEREEERLGRIRALRGARIGGDGSRGGAG